VDETPSDSQGFLGSYNYLAPEIFMGEFNEPKSDVWSIGAILFTLLSGKAPFSALDEDQVKA
jgi:serine/threonine protein kinase